MTLSRKLRKILFIFIVLSIVALSGAAYLNYRLKKAIPVSFDAIETTEDGGVRITGISYSGMRDNRLAWELSAKTATHYRDKGLTTLDGVTAVFYGDDGVKYELTSRDGSYDQPSGLITAGGGVVITSTEGGRIETGNLKYNEKTGVLTTDDMVVITTPEMDASGRGALVDVKNKRLKIFAQVRTEIRSDKK